MRGPSRRRLLAQLASLAAVGTQSRAAHAQQPASYDALIAAAKAEGTVSVDGPPLDTTREALTQGFQKRFGITVSYLGSGNSQSLPRLRAERTAGKYLLDVFVKSVDTPVLGFLPNGMLDRVEPALIAPDVVNVKNWRDGHLWYIDPQHTILRTFSYVSSELAVNTNVVKPGEVTTWRALLDPKWRGRIVAKDPTIAGVGASAISYLYLTQGPAFVQKLYQGQEPVLSRDPRQMAQWLADGSYPIAVAGDFAVFEEFRQLGYSIAPILPTDGPGMLTGGYGTISLINKAPHPNAAKLFINWLAGREGAAAFAKSQSAVSLRTDIAQPWAPAFEFPKPSGKYLDTFDYAFVTTQREEAFQKVRELLGQQ